MTPPRLTGRSRSAFSRCARDHHRGARQHARRAAFANQARREGMPRHEALLHAGTTRLRPIVMTTLAMIFGMLPLAFAIGAGAEMRAPMARAVIGGLITSTLLSLLVVPVVYTFLDDFRPAAVWAWLKELRRSPGLEKPDPAYVPARRT